MEEDDRIASLQFLTNRYIDNVWKHVGIHLLAAGWILSSTQLQSKLKESISVKLGLTVIFVVLQSVHSLVNVPLFKRLKKLEHQIDAASENLEAQIKMYPDLKLTKLYGFRTLHFIWSEIKLERQLDAASENPDLKLTKIYGVGTLRFLWNELMIGIIALFAIAFTWLSPYL